MLANLSQAILASAMLSAAVTACLAMWSRQTM
ncbi:hypothetical protein GGQ96_001364 [Sphingomonas abaci]|uniref:Uncharacterized protein n=1 Tax=Sphingomonas abaci TaxID=237611 RepID=A0A7W7AHQ5_9SPHN|nr:hypothetical protein [Sphingomonas abaci]